MNTLTERLKHHSKQVVKHLHKHRHKYVGGLFAGFAVVKMFVLLIGTVGILNHTGTFAEGDVYGCMDPAANNYIIDATIDDGSCTYTCGNGVTDPGETCDDGGSNGTPGMCNATCDGTEPDILPPEDIYGCTNPSADNYMAEATIDDGSCHTCGNGTIEGPETCDDSNTNNNDGCSASCQTEVVDPVVEKYYGSGSVYTTNRSGNSCNPRAMSVVYIDNYDTSGADTIPDPLVGDTIYVLLSGSHITSRQINLANCSAIVGSGDVTLYSTQQVGNAMIFGDTKQNIIINHVKINGGVDGLGASHEKNNQGIYLGSSTNNTINDTNIYNNQNGISLWSSSYNIIDNVQCYNNDSDGAMLTASSNNNTINNAQFYNNGRYGIFVYGSLNNTINNVQSYNNGGGLTLLSLANNNTISNTQIYNNWGGMYLQSSANNTFNNSQFYNNASYGIHNDSNSTHNKYYGNIKLFANNGGGSQIGDDNGNGIIQGSDQDYPEFLSGGALDESVDIMSCSRITNPINTNGERLINTDSHPTCDLKGQNGSRSGSEIKYLYGANILKQTQPIQDTATLDPSIFSRSTLAFDSEKFIAEVNPTMDGSLTTSPSGSTLERNIQITINTVGLANYELYGDFDESPLQGEIDGTGQVNITLTEGFGSKDITVRYSTGTKERIITQDITYIDPNGPAYRYYGSGSLYTSNRSGNTCDIGAMNVVYIDNYDTSGANILPETLTANTIYVLLPGSHITSRTINVATCSAIVGSGDVTLYSSDTLDNGMILGSAKQNNIIDNIEIDGFNDGLGSNHTQNTYGIHLANNSNNNTISNMQIHDNNNGIILSSSSNNIINNVQVYYNSSNGIDLDSNSNNNIINNTQIYNTRYYGITLGRSNNNIINNSQIYNNGDFGIWLSNSSNNTINNTQSYANTNHEIILDASSDNVINNVECYGSQENGIIFQNTSNNNVINNAQVYSNRNNPGIYNDWSSSNNRYYGTITLFANNKGGNQIEDDNGNGFVVGLSTDYPELFSGGSLRQDIDTMSCDRVTNPRNSNGTYLIDQGDDCINVGQYGGRQATPDIAYLYGVSLPLQTQPIQDTGTEDPSYLGRSMLSFDNNKYIAEINPLLNGSFSFIPNQTYVGTSNIQVRLWANTAVEYELAGDFLKSPIIGTMETGSIQTVTLTEGFGQKNFMVKYSTGGEEKDITTSITYIDPTSPQYIYFHSGSVYTSGRASNCNPVNMNVQYVDNYDMGGWNGLPSTLNTNTIYVLLSGSHVTTRTINLADCSAIVGSGDVTLYSLDYLGDEMIYGSSSHNSIIDHIKINGVSNGLGSTHEQNEYGIFLNNGSSNNTISNADIYNNKIGVSLKNNSNDNQILSTQIYENINYGIYLETSSNNSIIDTKTYNDGENGIGLEDSLYNTISKVKSYGNGNGISLKNASNNNTITTTETYENDVGMLLNNSVKYNTIDTIQSYNNTQGILFLNSAHNNTLNNVQLYNNEYGRYLENSRQNTTNNAQFYNNGNGIFISNAANTTVNNSAIYNNSDGIYTDASYGIFNNVTIYSNGGYGVENYGGENKYYGALRMFDNLQGNIAGNSLYAGSSEDYSGMFTEGISHENEETMSCTLDTNPVNKNGKFLIDTTGYPNCNFIGKNTSRTPTSNTEYMYGTSLLKQTVAVVNTGNSSPSVLGWSDLSRDTDKYIAQVNPTIVSSLRTDPSNATIERTIQITMYTAEPANYELYGDFDESPLQGEIDGTVQVNVALTEGLGDKTITARYTSGSKSSTKTTNIAYMEDGYPYQYYGTTTYTSGWTNNNCDPLTMSVQYIDNYDIGGPNTIPENLTTNTIYVLSSGTYINGRGINMTDCAAIVGSGDVTLYSSQYLDNGMIAISSKENTIINNVKIDGLNDGQGSTHTQNEQGIYVGSYAYNNTISNLQVYNNTQNGIILEFHADNNIIRNTQAYNNHAGIFLQTTSSGNTISRVQAYGNAYGIYLSNASHNTISDTQAYDNNSYGIALESSARNNTITNAQCYDNNNAGFFINTNASHNTINNSQSYNNAGHGITIQNSSSLNTINHAQIYNNNGFGIVLQNAAYNNTINNIQLYNNTDLGIYNDGGSTNNKYFGNIKLFANNGGGSQMQDDNGNGIIVGAEREYPEFFSGGVLDQSADTMSCERITNPINTNGGYLIDTSSYPTCNRKGQDASRSGSDIRYLYGTNILKQTQPIQDTSNTNPSVFSRSTVSFDTAKFIAEINPAIAGSLTLDRATLERNTLVTMTIAEPASYELYGDFDESPLQGEINGTAQVPVTLTEGLGNKTISVRYATGEKATIKTANIAYMEDSYPYQYYGTSTYISGWITNNCDPLAMNVQYVDNYDTSGADTIPEVLTANTIYVLQSGSYVTTNTINLANCSAIVGSGDVTVFSEQYLDNGMIYSDTKQNTIIDNIRVDGFNDGAGGDHVINTYGISLNNSSNNNTINNIESYNNSQMGILLSQSNHNIIDNAKLHHNGYGCYMGSALDNTITNTQSHDNQYGLRLSSAANNTITNTQSYNNDQYGIRLEYASENTITNTQSYNNQYGFRLGYSSNNTIDNAQSYNNTQHGIYLEYSSNNNTINNVQSYNNSAKGIRFNNQSDNNTINNSQMYNNLSAGFVVTQSSNNTINNSQIYNNSNVGLFLYSSANDNKISNTFSYNNGSVGIYNDGGSYNNKYFGNIKLFANNRGGDQIQDDNGNGLVAGAEREYPEFFSGGTLDQSADTMSCAGVSNPMNEYGIKLIDTDANPTCNLKGINNTRSGSDIKYFYGADILKQTQPVQDTATGNPSVFSRSTVSFDPAKYIAEINPTIDASLNINPNGATTERSVQVTINTHEPVNYTLSGDFDESPLQGEIDGTGQFAITLTETLGNKNITALFSTGNKVRALSESILYLDTNAPLYKYYHSGSLYARHRSGAICNIGEISTQVITDNTQRNNILNANSYILPENTIYVLESGDYTVDQGVNLNGCSTVVGSGDVHIYASQYVSYLFGINNTQGAIIDAVHLDGFNDGLGSNHDNTNYAVYMGIATNNTLSNLDISNARNGIYLDQDSNHNYLYNITTHDNTNHGLYLKQSSYANIVEGIISYDNNYGITIQESTYNVLNNIMAYNNQEYGIFINGSYNVLNNSSSFNNGADGIYQNGGGMNVYHNINVFSNQSNGMLINATNNILHNISTYNNGSAGIAGRTRGNNKYYGEIKSFNNSNNSIDFTPGEATDEAVNNVSWTSGSVNQTESMDCSRAINPLNADMTYLQDGSTTCAYLGIRGRSANTPISYNFGSNIAKQESIVQWNGSALEYSNGNIDTQLSVGQIWGNIQPTTLVTADTHITLQLATSESLTYTLSGDFDESPIQATLNGTGTVDINLLSGVGEKNIFFTVSNGTTEQRYVTTVNLVDPLVMTYYGSNSSYTTHWNENACNLGQMSVVNIADNNERTTLLNNNSYSLPGDTIYILAEGDYINQRAVYLSNCMAIVGSGAGAQIAAGSSATMFLNNNGLDNIILENIGLNGQSMSEYGIYFGGANNNTMSGIQLKGTTTDGIYMRGSSYNTLQGITTSNNGSLGVNILDYSTHNILEDVTSFNNAYLGIWIGNYSTDNELNNIQIYNNAGGIIVAGNADRNSISNAQIYRNGRFGLSIGQAESNTISNTMIYNNIGGIQNTDGTNILNNVAIYNNTDSFQTSNGPIKYYGSLRLFGNDTDDVSSLVAGTATGVATRGILNTTPQSMSCERVTNPIDNNGTSLRGGGDTTCSIRGNVRGGGAVPVQYRYGNNIFFQTRPITSTLEYSTLGRDASKYIAETNNISLRASLRFEPNRGYTIASGVQVVLSVDGEADYEMSGEFLESPIIGTLSGSEIQNITLTEGFGTKNISIRYVSGSKDASKTATITYMEDGLPYQYYGAPTYTSGWVENNCDPMNMNVQYIDNYDTSGPNAIPEQLVENTMYVLQSGSHITSRSIIMTGCTAIIGSGDVTIYTDTYLENGTLLGQNTQNAIIDNINIDGLNDGLGLTHEKNGRGIYLVTSSDNTVNGVKTYNAIDGMSFFNNSDYNTIANIQSYDNNNDGIAIIAGSDNNTIDNTQTHNNGSRGIYIAGDSNENSINNNTSYGNTNGIVIYSYADGNQINDSQEYNNAQYGIYITSYSNENIIDNTQSYNNAIGVAIDSNANNNTINNTQLYNNNGYGAYIHNSSSNNVINNTQVYNNNGQGISLSNYANDNTINNTQVYNNASFGIFFEYRSDNNKINSGSFFNNGSHGMYNDRSSNANTYYGVNKVFANNAGGVQRQSDNGGGLVQGLAETYPTYFSGGSLEQNLATMSCAYITNPKNTGNIYLIDEITYPECNFTGTNTSWTATDDVAYLYGISTPLQTQSIQDVATGDPSSYIRSDLARNTNNYTAEVNPLLNGSLSIVPDTPYTITGNIQLVLRTKLNADYELSGDFIEAPTTGTLLTGETINVTLTEGFGIKNFSIRYVTGSEEKTVTASIKYVDSNGLPYQYYSSGSEYTSNRAHNTCDIGSMNVEYINNYDTSGADVLPENLTGNTLYVLLSGSHITSKTIYMADCSAIVGSGDVTLYASQYLGNAMIYGESKSNVIIDNIKVDGTNDGIGGTPHQRNEMGINFNNTTHSTLIDTQFYNNALGGINMTSSSNNTVMQIKSYNNVYYGLLLQSNSTDNTISDVQTYNNTNGIFLNDYASGNRLSNIQSYNNSSYGIFVAQSAGNTFNDMQTYNNNYGIYVDNSIGNTLNGIQTHNNTYGIAAGDSHNTTINNTQSYNNASDGIGIVRSNNAMINNTQTYNNQRGIYINTSANTTVNNSQFYNNGDGIYIQDNGNNTTINNSASYNNNRHGIYTNSFNGKLNNVALYNNGLYAIRNNGGSVSYYGTLTMFENMNGSINGNGLTVGSSDDYPTLFSGGTLRESQDMMSCARATNPVNQNGIFLIDRVGYPTCNFIGKKDARTTSGDMQYLYGPSLPNQTVAVADTGSGDPSYLSLSIVSFDPAKYIAETNTTIDGDLLLIPDNIYTLDRNVQIQLTVTEPAAYTLYGDFEGSPIVGTLTNTGTEDITLTSSFENKDINVIYSTGGLQRTISKTIGYIENINDFCLLVTDVPQGECEDILSLYNNMNGSEWPAQDHRFDSTSIDNRYGITVTNGHVTQISLDGNNLSGDIPLMSHLSQLQSFSMVGNHIHNITNYAFSGLGNLQYLWLSSNEVAEISRTAFAGMSGLLNLDLSTNQIMGISGEAFSDLSNLQYLSLTNNQIESIGSGTFSDLDSLQQLDLAYNQITHISGYAFTGLPVLYSLLLYSNQITNLEANAFAGLPKLVNLYMYSNNISTWESGAFSGLSKVTNLHLASNNINSLWDKDFSGLPAVATLTLDSNKITTLKNGDFRELPNLNEIRLHSNQMVSIESGAFSGLTHLTSLTLQSNQLTSIASGTINRLPALMSINLNYNYLASIRDGMFNGLNNLNRLYLSRNLISSIKVVDFTTLPMLTSLYLDENEITRVASGAFMSSNGLPRLTTLNVSTNCSTSGTISIPHRVASNASIDNANCAVITQTGTAGFITNLTNRAYSISNSYYNGNKAISFNYPGINNRFMTNVAMNYVKPSWYVGDYYDNTTWVKYTSGTTITYNSGLSFTGILYSPMLFATGSTPGLNSVTTLMRFGALTHRIDFSQVITIRMSAYGKTSGDIVAIYSSDEESIFGENGSNWQFEKTGIVLGSTPYVEFTSTHASRYALSDEMPDITAPTASITYNPTSGTITSGNVIATLSGSEPIIITNNDGLSGYTFTESGSFTFEFRDLAGNTGSATARVTWIDKTVHTIPQSNPQQGGGGGGGGGGMTKDECPIVKCGDASPSYYDKTCGVCVAEIVLPTGEKEIGGSASAKIGSTSGSTYSDELNQAYLRAYGLDITTIPTIQKANMLGTITREQMAKMVVNYANKILKTPLNTGNICIFKDMGNETTEMKYYTRVACYLGIMGIKPDGTSDSVFHPKQMVTRAQFATILSRLLYGNTYDLKAGESGNRYAKHLQALNKVGIIKKINEPNMKELRGYVMLMLQRSLALIK